MNSIDDLKATISKKGGVAFANRFQVFFTPPGGVTIGNLTSQDPRVLVGSLATTALSGGSLKNIVPDPRDISILCETVNLPGRQISTNEYLSDRQAVKIPYGIINEDVTMSFILTNDYFMKKLFDNWMSGVFDVKDYRAGYKKDFTTDVIIQQLNSKNVPIYGVKLENAFPITMNSIQLDSNSENTVQKLNVTLSYENYIPEDIFDTAVSSVETLASGLGIG
tara:strand:- start:185 stop:850 length:666 start_codon:yes stop_codon:yes gene_type:complete